MNEMTLNSTELKDMILQEINLVSSDRLSELYRFIHSFRLGSLVASNGAILHKNNYYHEQLNSTETSNVVEATPDAKNDDTNSSEATLSLSSSWSNIPDEEFTRLLTDVYERRRSHYKEIEKPKSALNSPTMAEMLERLRVINEEESIELDIPPRVNRPVDLSFIFEDDDDEMQEVESLECLAGDGSTHAIFL